MMRRFFTSPNQQQTTHHFFTSVSLSASSSRRFVTGTFAPYYYSVPKIYRVAAMCCGCFGIFLAGNVYGAQEWESIEAVARVPDVDIISKDLMSTFEFRPDLAPTMIRLAFVLSVLRHRHKRMNASTNEGGSFPPPLDGQDAQDWAICNSFTGLDEAIEVLTFHHMAHPVSMSDLTVIAAIAAIKFLRGPTEGLAFKWGRTDTAVEAVVLAEEAVQAADKKAQRKERKQRLDVSKRADVRLLTNVANDENPLEGGGRKAFFKDAVRRKQQQEGTTTSADENKIKKKEHADPADILTSLRAFLPGLNDEQIASLFALHGCGEFHRDVSGVERRVKPSRCNYVLSAQYYRTMSRLPFTPDAVQQVPRSQQNKHVQQLPYIAEAPIQVMGMAGSSSKVRRTCACPVSEFKLLLGADKKKESALLGKYVERFSDRDFGQQIWENAFTTAMQQVFDSECGVELHDMPDKDEIERRKFMLDWWWLPSSLASALIGSTSKKSSIFS